MSEWSTEERLVEEAVEAIGEGRPVVLPTDTVYGLCTTPLAPESLTRLKGRGAEQPIALLASEVDILLELVPELPDAIVRSLLPGRLTLIFPNPEDASRSCPPWTRSACACRSSAAQRGGSSRAWARLPRRVRTSTAGPTRGGSTRCRRRFASRPSSSTAASFPARPSTVVDLTGPRPSILREGAVPATEVLERLEQQG